jgi:hypothetical protein
MHPTYLNGRHAAVLGFFYMGVADIDDTTINRAVLASTTTMKPVLSSASETEIGTLFINCKKATILQTTLQEMGYPQPATPMQTNNSTVCRIVNNNIKHQQSHAIVMRFSGYTIGNSRVI